MTTTFVSRISPTTGKLEWVAQDDNYDYHQEVARSAYADMLHDTERNQMYYKALKLAISEMKHRGKQTHVLDIGTGTGLLSMMAARSGADKITACEAFAPMAECAQKVIQDNGLADKIKLIRKRSTDITVGPDGDMLERANILVTEVFDTELIGEGGISTFKHAHQHLLDNDCIVVPSAANMYAQVVQSEILRQWNTFQPIRMDDNDDKGRTHGIIDVPTDIAQCPGTRALHDLQLDQIPQADFQPISNPIKVFRFDYSGKSEIIDDESSHKTIAAISSGRCDAVFMWWDLEMDTKAEVLLSCAPRWAHPTPKQMQWRDHWMQAIYHLPTPITVEDKQSITVHSYHDEYSLWFNVTPTNSNSPSKCNPPSCQCGAHIACSRPRIAMINDTTRNQKYIEALKKVVTNETVCLCLSEGSLLPLAAARLGAKKVYTVHSEQSLSSKMVRSYCKHNGLESKVELIEKTPEYITAQDFDNNKISLVIGEPFFSSSILSWHNLYFWYAATELAHLFTPDVRMLPSRATLYCVAVDFKDLWNIRGPVVVCEGFQLDTFDKLIEKAMDIADDFMEAQPLWEYPGTALSEAIELMSFDLSKPLGGVKTASRKGHTPLSSAGCCNGVAVWVEYNLEPKMTVTSGLSSPAIPGQPLHWERSHKQAVHLFKTPVSFTKDKLNKAKLHYGVTFKPSSGDFVFGFKVTV